MANYQHKRSPVAGKIPLAGDLLEGEIAVNIKDRKLFAKDDQGTVFEFLGENSGGVDTVNGVAPVAGNVALNALNIPPTADRLWLTQAERQLIAGFDAYDKVESDDRYLLESNNLSDLTNVTTARTNLGLGTAATRDVGEVAGNVMEVGAFGLGGYTNDSSFLPDNTDLNTVTLTGFYTVPSSALNLPSAGSYAMQVIGRASTYTTQILVGRVGSANADMWIRYQNSTVWGSWVKVYHTGDILGTVSQSEGVPTGAIIESGSNANGSYVKYADGTMICRSFLKFTRQAANRLGVFWTYPTAFFGSPVVCPPLLSGRAIDSTNFIVTDIQGSPFMSTSTETQANLLYITTTDDPLMEARDASGVAIGRWW